nr:hypothetical protein [uncultured Mediterranean phage uvMED]BAR26968.1 hypothetical protein [uncultured Mediterranean phage uvMED]
MALRTSQRLLLAKAETTYGTDSTPTGTANAILVRNLEITPIQADAVERELIRGYMGNYEVLLANQRVEITFDVEMAASGTAGTAPKWGPVMKACGNSETVVANTSVTYAPISSTFPSVSLYYYTDGVRHKVTGARGSFSINAEVGQIPTISFSMVGIYNAPDDSANPTPTYSNQAKPVLFKNGNTTAQQLFSYAGAVQSFSFDQSNNITYRELVGGSKEVLITDRRPGGSIVLEAVTMATQNYFTSITGTATGNNTFQHGQTAGNKFTFSAPQTDLSSVSYSDSDGIQMLNFDYTATPTTAGNNEYSLALT